MSPGTLQQYLYLGILAVLGGAAVVRAVATLVPWLATVVPPLCVLYDPGWAIIDHVLPRRYTGHVSGGTDILHRYAAWQGPLILSLLIVTLAVRRLHIFRAAGSRAAPHSFSGFPLALVAIGIPLLALAAVVGPRPFAVLIIGTENPCAIAVILVFVTFLMTEVASLRSGGASRAEGAQETPLRRRPVWSVLSLVFPMLGLLGFLLLALARTPLVFFGPFPAAIGTSLGVVATIVAIGRRERWLPLQVVAFLVNFGYGVPLIVGLLLAVSGR